MIISPINISSSSNRRHTGGVSMSAETLALVARMVTTPSTALTALIDKTIVDLKLGGFWDNIDVLWFTNLHTEQASSLNWKGNDTFNLTNNHSTAWAAKVGFTGATNDYLSTNYVPATHGVKFTQNDASYGCYIHTMPSAGVYVAMGCAKSDSTRNSWLLPNRGSGGRHAGVNSSLEAYSIDKTETGLHVATRKLSTASTWCSPNSNDDNTNNSQGLSDQQMTLLAYNYGTIAFYFVGGKISFAYMGAGITTAQYATLKTIVDYFCANVGGTF